LKFEGESKGDIRTPKRKRLKGYALIPPPYIQTRKETPFKKRLKGEQTKMENETKLETLLEELEEAKQTSAYGQNHLLDTMISRVKELINNKLETEICIGF